MEELGRAGFPVEPGFYSHEGASDAARRLFSRRPRPDAVFCANDVMAAAAIDVARGEFNLRIPDDVAFVGYDNSALAEWPAYSLTSLEQNLPEIARLAVEALTASAASAPPRRVVVPSRLIVRGSTVRAPGAAAP